MIGWLDIACIAVHLRCDTTYREARTVCRPTSAMLVATIRSGYSFERIALQLGHAVKAIPAFYFGNAAGHYDSGIVNGQLITRPIDLRDEPPAR